VFFTLEHFSI